MKILSQFMGKPIEPGFYFPSGTSSAYYPIGEFDSVSLNVNLIPDKVICSYCQSVNNFSYHCSQCGAPLMSYRTR